MEFKNYVLKNRNDLEVHVTNYGGIITRILTKDKAGKTGDIILGFDQAEDYEKYKQHPYFGAIIGRYGNRIAKGRFSLNGKEYQLALNNAPNHLHGGIKGFDKVFWESKQDGNKIFLSYLSPEGEEGYPGNLKVNVTYQLTDADELKIDYLAETDKATPINLTQHSYFNLSAMNQETILDHLIQINADMYTEVDHDLNPTGRLLKVVGTNMDLTTPKKVEGRFDHNYVLREAPGIKYAATLSDPESGRIMEVWTTEPGIQFYSGNFLDGKILGKEGRSYMKNGGLCLETQHFPDSPNHPEFPTTILEQGKKYTSTTVYKFGVI
jgi:aldose 1-epimerase